MSIVACVKVYDGMVLGAESMSQLYGPSPGPGQQPQFVKAFSNARKLFQVRDWPFGVLSYGAGNIGNRSIESFLGEFNQLSDLPNGDQRSAEAIATRLLQFMRTPYDVAFGQVPEEQRPLMGFYLAGYSLRQHLGSEWEFVLPNDARPRQSRVDDQCGAAWRGVTLPFARLYFGFDSRVIDALRSGGLPQDVLTRIQIAANSVISSIVFDGMPIQDAIGFCKFILETTIGVSTYEAGVPSCGGPLHIAIITKAAGFSWITKPEYLA